MYENDYLYAVDRNDDYLAHYGIKGMHWGVRKAIERGGAGLDNKRLGRQYQKAARKLAKLEKRAASGKKYAARAARLGVGAAAAGGLAAFGTSGVANKLLTGSNFAKGNRLLRRAGINTGVGTKGAVEAGRALSGKITDWGNKSLLNTGVGTKSILDASRRVGTKAAGAAAKANRALGTGMKTKDLVDSAHRIANAGGQKAIAANRAVNSLTRGQALRLGAGALGLGLAGAAGYNAYRAATTKRAARKAAEWRKEMNKNFAGTAYASGAPQKQNHRRRKNRR